MPASKEEEATRLDGKAQPDDVATSVERVGVEPATTVERLGEDSVEDTGRQQVPRELKATIDLEDSQEGILSDGWSLPPEDLEQTGSRMLPSAEKAAPEPVPAEDEDPDAPRLICIQGPDEGREFVLKRRDVSIGRATDNDVVLNDASVSRLHCRILIDEGQYVATDQRSGNGTIVNGRRIERQNLTSGTTLKMGQTTLRFVEMGDVIKSTETAQHKVEEAERSARSNPITQPKLPPKRIDSARWAIGIVGGAVFLALVIIIFGVSGKQTTSPEIARTPSEIAESALADAALALQAKQIDTAREKQRKAANATPDDPRVPALLARIDREEQTLNALAEARALARKGELVAAYAKLRATSRETAFASDLVATQVELDRALEPKLAEVDADALLEVLPEDSPLRDRLRNKKKHPTSAAPAQPKPEHKGPPDSGATKRAMDAFLAGQADNALDTLGGELDNEGLALKNKIIKFNEVLKAASDVAGVKKALAFESKIAGGKSAYATQLKRKLGDAELEEGLKLMAQQRQLDAYRMFKDALGNNPDLAQAKKKMSDIQALARDVFNQGYILKDSDRAAARDKWQRVLTMVPPEDETHQKAKKWLDSLK